MRNILKKIAVTTGVASAALVLGTTQAIAFPATTWTVTPTRPRSRRCPPTPSFR
ncbi:hypothetical protein NKH18_44405 [Streptomyces sp. M10(2022)]